MSVPIQNPPSFLTPEKVQAFNEALQKVNNGKMAIQTVDDFIRLIESRSGFTDSEKKKLRDAIQQRGGKRRQDVRKTRGKQTHKKK